MVVKNSLRQMLRTPVKTVSFLLLITLTALFLSVGANLLLFTRKSLETYEKSFKTIGTVQQQPKMLKECAVWDQSQQAYSYATQSVYDRLIPLSVLDFANANYIHSPEKRPFYGAYDENYNMGDFYQSNNTQWIILEFSPTEDCIPSNPVPMKVKRVLYGKIGEYTKDALFCDPDVEKPQPMYADKTYILSVNVSALSSFYGYEDHNAFDTVLVPAGGVESTQYDQTGAQLPDLYGAEAEGWEEVTEGYFNTPRGQRWAELIQAIKRLPKTIPVIPTSATQLLMAFYSGSANITEGRDISPEEYTKGAKVCLVQRQFAQYNGITPGDSLPLPLYYADYLHTPMVTGNLYYGGLLNAQGKAYPVFENSAYTVVGIYDNYGASYESSDFDLVGNTVIIPAASVKNSDAQNIIAWGPMRAATTSFEIPNGTIDSFEEEWNRQGIDGLKLTFYDKGYSRLKQGLDRIHTISLILLLISTVVMVLVLTLFTFLFIIKNQKRTAIERSLGYHKRQCAASLLSGMLLILVIGSVIGAGGGAWFCNTVIDRNMSASEGGSFDLTYSSWANDTEKLAEMRLDLNSAGIGILITFCLSITTGTLIAGVGVRRNLKAEPILLLSGKDDSE